MKESWASRMARWWVNFAPAYRGTGARISRIAADYREVHVHLPLTWRTRNHHNMIWGGSLYAALDPVYGVMLWKLLGKHYFVIDKSAHIAFLRPGKGDLHARFIIDEEETQTIRNLLKHHPKIDRTYTVTLNDTAGRICARCEKTVHIRHRDI